MLNLQTAICLVFVTCSVVSGLRLAKRFEVGTKENPGKSCLDIKTQGGTVSQNYYVKLYGHVFRVYCDQTTAGGGWTLVYSFKYTAKMSAVTPRPSWPLYGETRLSLIPPQGENDFNALDYKFWAPLGRTFMVKSNHNNWIACSEGTGSLIKWRSGSLKCKIVKQLTDKCPNIVPNAIKVDFYWSGPSIYDDRLKDASKKLLSYYSFDTWVKGSEQAYSNPCGTGPIVYNGSKILHGSLYFR